MLLTCYSLQQYFWISIVLKSRYLLVPHKENHYFGDQKAFHVGHVASLLQITDIYCILVSAVWLWGNKSWELRSFSVWIFWPENVEVYDKYNGCSLYSTVKVLILSHISVWRRGLKISRSWCWNIWSRSSIWSLRNSWKLKAIVSSRWSPQRWSLPRWSPSSWVQEDGISSFQLLHAGRALRMIRLAKLLSLIRFSYW